MDTLDIRILRELAQPQQIFPSRPGVDLSYRLMAKKLGVSSGTVRERLRKMKSSGFVMESKVLPHPGLLGLQMGVYAMETSPSLEKSEVTAKLRLVDGVVVVQNHHGAYVGLVFVYEDKKGLERKLELLRRIGGAASGICGSMTFPPCNVRLKPVDWEVISRLVRGVPGAPAQVAGEVGISVRTLRRRLVKMVRAGVVFTQPNVNFGALQNAVPADATVTYTRQELRADAWKGIMRMLDDYLFYSGVWGEMDVYSMILPNPYFATRLAGMIRQVAGVKTARVDLVDEHLDQMEVFAGYVDRHLERVRTSVQ
ncbi:MAG: winged helix-turn-helix transcriptional regulator [Nitrososphaerota archaeon]|nr:winged helix-turn-helix transcriptional regulator [Nitrososphaerota archaeon]MDG7024775.1 winged helix-turn-helix transcriptional regulator [Nitrososphaerota archaeon]